MAEFYRFGLAIFILFSFATSLTAMQHNFKPKDFIKPVAFSSLPGWAHGEKKLAFRAFVQSCRQMQDDNRAFSKKPLFGGRHEDWRPVCDAARKLGKIPTSEQIHQFFETGFTALRVMDHKIQKGLFTGYYEPEVEGNLEKSKTYSVPIYAKPSDLVSFDARESSIAGVSYGRYVNKKPTPYFTRQEIELGALKGRNLEILWLKSPIDAFFMQIQGSGRVRLPDGTFVRLAYAAKTGLPYTPVGSELVKTGAIGKDKVSMQTIRHWMETYPKQAIGLRRKNKSFVFFRLLDKQLSQNGPIGAQGIALTPQVSLAIDRRYWPFGMPVWLDTSVLQADATTPSLWRELLIAQDTGSAIRGMSRGDVFWGGGRSAAHIAGHMKSAGEMTVLLPTELAKKLLAK